MDEQQEILSLRQRMHDLADKLAAATTRTEVTATKLEGAAAQLDRIEDALKDLVSEKRAQNGRIGKTEDRLTVLETRADDARHSGSKWGAGAGSLAGFLGGLLGGFVKGAIGGHS